jgi:hypothetical protein
MVDEPPVRLQILDQCSPILNNPVLSDCGAILIIIPLTSYEALGWLLSCYGWYN